MVFPGAKFGSESGGGAATHSSSPAVAPIQPCLVINLMSWTIPPPDWSTPAGRILDQFFEAIQGAFPEFSAPITLFGSAAIQVCLDESFTSADVDLMVASDSVRLRDIAREAGVGRSGTIRPAYGVQICPPQLFRPTPHYLQRAHIEQRYGQKVVVPHVRDILIAKLHRSRTEGQDGLVAKDLRAFQRVRELCDGHPTRQELIDDLQLCEPDFRLPVDGGVNSFRLNALDLFSSVFHHPLDLENEVLKPARAAATVVIHDHGKDIAQSLADLRADRD